MSVTYKQLEVTCPICQAVKKINVPESIFLQKKFGSIKIQIPSGAVCPEHQFIVFVDPKGIIRGYEKIDILMGAPIEPAKESVRDKGKISLKRLIQEYGLYGVFSLMHAKVFNYPSYIIKDKSKEDIAEIVNSLLDRIMPDKYKEADKLQFIDDINYDKIKLKEKNALLIDSHSNILETPWEDKLKFEEGFIKKALEIINDEEQLILIEQDIAKFVKEVDLVVGILKEVKEIYEDDLIERIAKDLKVLKINHYRLTLIKDFIRQRIDAKLPSKIKNKVEEFLNLL